MTGIREKAQNLLECFHSVVCGPMQTSTHNGERYFVTFVDEASGRIALSLLQGKHQVLENFASYRHKAEREMGKNIKTLRSDGGGEYVNEKTKGYLVEAKIIKITTPPYTPAQN